MNYFRPLHVILALASIYALPGLAKADCELRVGWDDWPPYITHDGEGFHGLEYELLKSTADAAGCTLDMVPMPWVRALKMLRFGGLDLLYGAGYSAERAEYASFSVPYRHEQFVLVTKGNASNAAKFVSLNAWTRSKTPADAPRTLGVFRGNYYGKQIEEILKNNKNDFNLFYASRNEQLIGMIHRNNLDGYIVEKIVFLEEMQELSHNVQFFHIEEQIEDPIHYMFSSNISANIIERFNGVIRSQKLAK